MVRFRSTLPRRERPDVVRLAVRWRRSFDPRSREGSDACLVITTTRYPRSREGSDKPGSAPEPLSRVSIHAPAKGATAGSDMLVPGPKLVSIHAPAKGATRKPWRAAFDHRRFRSTLPRRERPGWRCRPSRARSVSIHAPAKGATACGRLLTAPPGFDPRSREGSDPTVMAE